MLLGDEEEEENGNLLPNVTEDVDPITQDSPDSSQGSHFFFAWTLVLGEWGGVERSVGWQTCEEKNRVKINLIWNPTLKIW